MNKPNCCNACKGEIFELCLNIACSCHKELCELKDLVYPLQTKMDVAKIIDDFAFPKDYNKQDHTHCFDDKNPPCGQRIKHYMCCLCEKKNPELINRLIERVEKMRGYDNYGEISDEGQLIEKKEVLEILKGELQ